MACLQMSENDLVDSILILYLPVGSQDRAPVVMFSSNCVYLLSHLTGFLLLQSTGHLPWLAFVLYMCLFSLTE